MANQYQPQRLGRGGSELAELLLKQVAVRFVGRFAKTNRRVFRAGSSRGFFPAAGPFAKGFSVFLRPFCADDNNHGGPRISGQRDELHPWAKQYYSQSGQKLTQRR